MAAETLYVGFLEVPGARTRLPAYLALHAAAGILSILAAAILSGSRPGFLILAAAVFRATLLFRSPDLSDDIQRYLWDARVASAGFSPWAYAPDDPALADVAPSLRARVAHRDVRSVYPPVAQAAFRVGSFGGRRPRALKALFAVCDVAIVWLLARQRSVFAAALYAFHPLPVLEVAGQGHLDALGVALLLAALALLGSGRRAAAGVGFALSVLTKYMPLAALLPMARRGGSRFVLAGAAVVSALWLASARGGVTPAGGLPDYATRWSFNSAVYPAAVGVMRASSVPARAKALFLDLKRRLGHPAWTESVFPYFYDAFFARAALGVMLALVLLAVGLRVAETRAAVFGSLAAVLVFSPTVQPWYLLWTLPFAAERREPAFLYLSFAVPLSYALLYPTRGLTPPRVLALEYAPFAALLAVTLFRAGRRARAS